jgi:mono/diheme cytochrome c family protein
MRHRGVTLLVLTGLAVGGLLVALVWRPAIPSDRSSPIFGGAEISRGAQLAAIGNCNSCHTREDGPPYAGGRPIATPFGTIHGTNITPEGSTGIGGWSERAFIRAMRDGVSRDGHHLYPAFPYDHMTKMREDDIKAVYAFVMTRRPVSATPPPNDLPFPLNVRALVAGWKLLFLDRSLVEPDPSKSPDWNRGAYLVEGLGHCGACHTPRNFLGAEKRGQAYAGGESEGWIAPALNAATPAAVPWDVDRLHAYLRHGFDDLHGVAAGPMAPVVKNLGNVPADDVRAIATYVASVAGAPTPERQARADKATARARGEIGAASGAGTSHAGAAIYAAACAQCHGEAGRMPSVRALNLALSSSLRNPRPDNLIRIVRDGIHPSDGGVGPLMPGFADALTDAQLIALAAYLRAEFADAPPWNAIADDVRRAKRNEADKTRTARDARMSL